MNELLRYWAFKLCGKGEQEDAASDVMTAAATEIERLHAENARLREAASEYMRAMEGFASAVREDVGLAYPWPAQEITRAKIRAALEVKS